MLSGEAIAADVRSWIVDDLTARSGPRKAVLAEIAREVGLHTRRIAAYFYSEVRTPTAAEVEQLRRWRKHRMIQRIERADHEMAILKRRLADMANDDR